MNWLQRHWDARAAANFILGGTGSGLAICSLLLDSPAAIPLALALVAAGLTAVWLETGRKLRAVNVFLNPFTSWMSREAFAALLLFASIAYAPLAAPAALVFLYCQARILHAAKGIPAWRAPQVVPLIVFTGLAEGSGLALLFSSHPVLILVFALTVLARLIAWLRHPLAPHKRLAWWSTGAALVLLPVLPPLAGLAALAAGWWLKFALVTRASLNQGYSLPHLPVRGAR